MMRGLPADEGATSAKSTLTNDAAPETPSGTRHVISVSLQDKTVQLRGAPIVAAYDTRTVCGKSDGIAGSERLSAAVEPLKLTGSERMEMELATGHAAPNDAAGPKPEPVMVSTVVPFGALGRGADGGVMVAGA